METNVYLFSIAETSRKVADLETDNQLLNARLGDDVSTLFEAQLEARNNISGKSEMSIAVRFKAEFRLQIEEKPLTVHR